MAGVKVCYVRMSLCTYVLDVAVNWHGRQQGSKKIRHHAIKRQRPHFEVFTGKCCQTGGLHMICFVYMCKARPSIYWMKSGFVGGCGLMME